MFVRIGVISLGPALVLGLGITAAGLLPGAPAQATVTCPAVDHATGAVTPAPAPSVDWSGCDLAAANLANANLTDADLASADLSGAALTDANLTGAGLESADLAHADLASGTLTGTDMEDVNLTGTELAGAAMAIILSGGVTGTPASLPSDWSLAGGYLLGPTAFLESADLHGLDLNGADLDHANLIEANLAGADLTMAGISQAELDYADLTDATLAGVNGIDASLHGAKLAGSVMGGAQLAGASLVGVTSGGIQGAPASLPANWEFAGGYLIGPGDTLTDANLAGIDLAGADVAGSNLTSADLAGADLSSANLSTAVLTGANLSGASLADADLTAVLSGGIKGKPAELPANWLLVNGYLAGPQAELPGAKLSGANLSGADLAGAVLESADLASADVAGADVRSADVASANLTDTDLSSADLTAADLDGTNLNGAVLADATLTGARAFGIQGTPASLPSDWQALDGFLLGPGAYLQQVDLRDADLAGADLAAADLRGAILSGTNLADANLSDADLDQASLDDVSLDGAVVTGATFNAAYWFSTTCPDGTSSDKYVDGCFSAPDTEPPVAAPVVAGGTAGANGWYTTSVTVDWNWTDNGTISTLKCVTESPAYLGTGSVTLHATCADLAGNIGQASFTVKVDGTVPVVSVTGVNNGARYAVGHVPAAGCSTAEYVSGVATKATVKVGHKGDPGLGSYTATCSGATSVAGTSQAAPVAATYSAGYGLPGFTGLHVGSRIYAPGHRFTVRFRLIAANGRSVPGSTAAALARRRDVEVRLSGPFIRSVTATCRWDTRARDFACTVRVPAGARADWHEYKLAAQENVGAGFMLAPAAASMNPLTVRFRFRR